MSATDPRTLVWQVALPVPLPRLFDYRPATGTASTADVGCRVRVPFGSRELVGLVAGVAEASPGAPEPKPGACLDRAPLFHGELLESLLWLARYTHAPLGEYSQPEAGRKAIKGWAPHGLAHTYWNISK